MDECFVQCEKGGRVIESVILRANEPSCFTAQVGDVHAWGDQERSGLIWMPMYFTKGAPHYDR